MTKRQFAALFARNESDFPDARSPSLWGLIDRVIASPEAWLSTPNPQFGDRAPGELVGTDEEVKVVNLLRAVDRGLF